MLLRRFTKHVNDQNWFAIFLDFLIVVVGVFIGIQLGNWNEARNNAVSLEQSLVRLQFEVEMNIDSIDKSIARINHGREDRENAIFAIKQCSASEENLNAINSSMNDMAGDILPTFLDNSIEEIARQDRFLQLLSPEFRRKFNAYQTRIEEESEQLVINFGLMWDSHVIRSSKVDADTPETKEIAYGVKLAFPIEDICQDTDFRRQFFGTHAFFESTLMRLENLKMDAKEFSQALSLEQER